MFLRGDEEWTGRYLVWCQCDRVRRRWLMLTRHGEIVALLYLVLGARWYRAVSKWSVDTGAVVLWVQGRGRRCRGSGCVGSRRGRRCSSGHLVRSGERWYCSSSSSAKGKWRQRYSGSCIVGSKGKGTAVAAGVGGGGAVAAGVVWEAGRHSAVVAVVM